jgi:Arc/MetJ family transcription regulator
MERAIPVSVAGARSEALIRPRKKPEPWRDLASYTKSWKNGVRLEPTGKESQVARTNIDIDEKLIQKAIKLTGARSKREAVEIALRRLVEKGTLYSAIRKLKGKFEWSGDLETWRKLRR